MKKFTHEKKYFANRQQLSREEAIKEINQLVAGSGPKNHECKTKHNIADEEHILAIVSQAALLRRLMAKSYPWLVHSQQPENAIDFQR